MDFFGYISSNNSSQAVDLLRSYSDESVRNEQELSNALKGVYRALPNDQKSSFLNEMAQIHPDMDLFATNSYATGNDNEHCNCHACQMRNQHGYMGANGLNAVSNYMSANALAENNLKNEITELKSEANANRLMNDKLFKMLVMGIGAVVLYKLFIKS